MARPRKQVWEGEIEDQPTYVVENSQDTLSKAEYEALLVADKVDKQDEKVMPPSAKLRYDIEEIQVGKDKMIREGAPVKQQVAGIGRSKKRRLAKVFGDENVEEEEDEKGGEDEEEGEEKKEIDKAVVKGSLSGKKDKNIRATKAKKMKLSFDEVDTEA